MDGDLARLPIGTPVVVVVAMYGRFTKDGTMAIPIPHKHQVQGVWQGFPLAEAEKKHGLEPMFMLDEQDGTRWLVQVDDLVAVQPIA